MNSKETVKEAKRYRLLRNYLLRNGYIIHQIIDQDDEPFVTDTDFYGQTLEDAVDALERSGQASADELFTFRRRLESDET